MDYSLQHKLKLAVDFESQGKLLHSINIYNSIIDEYPDYPEAYINLAVLYEKTGSISAAKLMFETVIELDETEIDFKFEYGKFLMRTLQFEKAVDVFKKNPADEEPLCSSFIGILNLFLENYEEAKVHLLNFVISDEAPELICEAYFFLAKAEFELKQYDNALKHINKAEIILTGYWELYLLRALIYYSQSMFNHAEKNITKAIQVNQNEVINYYWAGKILLANSDFKRSAEYFSTYLKLNGITTSEKLFNRVGRLIGSGKFREALVTYQKAKKFNVNLNYADEELRKSNFISEKK